MAHAMLSFMAGPAELRGGVNVGADVRLEAASGPDDILTVVGDNSQSWVRAFDGETCTDDPAGSDAHGFRLGPGRVAGRRGGPEFNPECVLPDTFPYQGEAGVAPRNLHRPLRHSPRIAVATSCRTISVPRETRPPASATVECIRRRRDRNSFHRSRLGRAHSVVGPQSHLDQRRRLRPRRLNGSGWVDSWLPSSSSPTRPAALIVVSNGTTARYFDDNDPPDARHFLQDTLVHDSGASQYVFTDTKGNQIRFWDFSTSVPANRRGQFESFADAAGNVVRSRPDADGKVAKVRKRRNRRQHDDYRVVPVCVCGRRRERRHDRERHASPPDQLRVVVHGPHRRVRLLRRHRVAWQCVRLEDGDGQGRLRRCRRHELLSLLHRLGVRRVLAWAEVRVRSRLVCTPQGRVFGPDDCDARQAAVYADHFLEFDGSRRVTLHAGLQGEGCSTCTGGLGTYTYSYSSSSHAEGYNRWEYRRRSRRCRTGIRTSFTPTPMARSCSRSSASPRDAAEEWVTFYQYDGAG